MAALTASSTMVTSLPSGSSLTQSAERFVKSSSEQPFHIVQHRDKFQERALRDVTTNSNESAMMLDPNNPTLVKGEMEAQKDFFRRLKFTYLEQEAKRNFLYSITGEEPQGVPPGENEELEQINAEKKMALKGAKEELNDMRATTIQLAKENASRHAEHAKQLAEVQAVYSKIKDAELEIQRIRTTHPPESRMTVVQANEILDNQVEEMERLTEAIGTTGAKRDTAREEVARVGRELQRLGREREREEARAKEVREGREAGDTKVDEMCRWLTSSMTFYRSLLGIRSVTAVPPNALHLEYDTPSPTPLSKSRSAKAELKAVTLILDFDPVTKRLAAAHLLGSDADIGEAADIAVASNDVPGLVAEVLMRLRPIAA